MIEVRGRNASRIKMRFFAAAAIFVLALAVWIAGATARQAPSNKPQTDKPPAEKSQPGKPEPAKAKGQLIVASRDLPDPLFHDSVVLMLPIKEGPLIVGLIVNRPLKVKVRELFPDTPGLESNESPVYFGGPVDADVGARSAIFRSKTPREKATQVFADIYVTFDPGVILALAENPQQASNVRVFVGRAQWDPDQFEGEVARGSWHNLPAIADSIFSVQPEMLWPSLIERVEPHPVVQSAPRPEEQMANLQGLRPPREMTFDAGAEAPTP